MEPSHSQFSPNNTNQEKSSSTSDSSEYYEIESSNPSSAPQSVQTKPKTTDVIQYFANCSTLNAEGIEWHPESGVPNKLKLGGITTNKYSVDKPPSAETLFPSFELRNPIDYCQEVDQFTDSIFPCFPLTSYMSSYQHSEPIIGRSETSSKGKGKANTDIILRTYKVRPKKPNLEELEMLIKSKAKSPENLAKTMFYEASEVLLMSGRREDIEEIDHCGLLGSTSLSKTYVESTSIRFFEAYGMKFEKEELQAFMSETFGLYISSVNILEPCKLNGDLGTVTFAGDNVQGMLRAVECLSAVSNGEPIGIRLNPRTVRRFVFGTEYKSYEMISDYGSNIMGCDLEQVLVERFSGSFHLPQGPIHGEYLVTDNINFVQFANQGRDSAEGVLGRIKFSLVSFNGRKLKKSSRPSRINVVGWSDRLPNFSPICHSGNNPTEQKGGKQARKHPNNKKNKKQKNSRSPKGKKCAQSKPKKEGDNVVPSALNEWLAKRTICWNSKELDKIDVDDLEAEGLSGREVFISYLRKLMANTIECIKSRRMVNERGSFPLPIDTRCDVYIFNKLSDCLKKMVGLPQRLMNCSIQVLSKYGFDYVFYVTRNVGLHEKVGFAIEANPNIPGGSCHVGWFGAEESMCRRSTLLCSLDPKNNNLPMAEGDKVCYPLDVDKGEVVMTSGVHIFRGDEGNGGGFVISPPSLTVFSVGFRTTEWGRRDSEIIRREDVEVIFRSLATMFMAAVLNEITILVIRLPKNDKGEKRQIAITNVILYLVSVYKSHFSDIKLVDPEGRIPYPQEFARNMENSQPEFGLIPHPSFFSEVPHSEKETSAVMPFVFPKRKCERGERCMNMDVTHRFLFTHDVGTRSKPFTEFTEDDLIESCRLTRMFSEVAKEFASLSSQSNKCATQGCVHPQKPPKPSTKKMECEKGLLCIDITKSHLKRWSHEQSPLSGNLLDPLNRRTVCASGEQCPVFKAFINRSIPRDKEETFLDHMRRHVHLPRRKCPHGSSCPYLAKGDIELDEDHLALYTHPGILDFRERCEKGSACVDYSLKHRLSREHPPNFKGQKGPDLNLCHRDIDFICNSRRSEVLGGDTCQFSKGIIPRFKKCLRQSRPMHRLGVELLEAYLVFGQVISGANESWCDECGMILKHSDEQPDLLEIYKRHPEEEATLRQYFSYAVSQFISSRTTESFPNYGEIQEREEIEAVAKALIRGGKVIKAANTGASAITGLDGVLPVSTGADTSELFEDCFLVFDRKTLYLPSTWCSVRPSALSLFREFNSGEYNRNALAFDKEDQLAGLYWKHIRHLGVNEALSRVVCDILTVLQHQTGELSCRFDAKRLFEELIISGILEGYIASGVSMADVRAILISESAYSKLSSDGRERLRTLSKKTGCRIVRCQEGGNLFNYMHEVCMLDTTKEEENLKGFSFVLGAKLLLRLPFRMNESHNHLTLGIHGGPLFVQFTRRREVVATLRISGPKVTLMHEGNPTEKSKSDAKPMKEKRFDLLDRDISRRVQISLRRNRVVLEHVGLERTLCVSPVEYQITWDEGSTDIFLFAQDTCKVTRLVLLTKNKKEEPTYPTYGKGPRPK